MKNLAKILALSLALLFVQGTCSTASVFAKSSKHKKVRSKKSKHSKHSKHSKKRVAKKLHLVPPPPPYAPAILPELAYSKRYGKKSKEEVQEEKPNPYAKYIYHRDTRKIPTPVRSSNRGTTTWVHDS